MPFWSPHRTLQSSELTPQILYLFLEVKSEWLLPLEDLTFHYLDLLSPMRLSYKWFLAFL